MLVSWQFHWYTNLLMKCFSHNRKYLSSWIFTWIWCTFRLIWKEYRKIKEIFSLNIWYIHGWILLFIFNKICFLWKSIILIWKILYSNSFEYTMEISIQFHLNSKWKFLFNNMIFKFNLLFIIWFYLFVYLCQYSKIKQRYI